MSQNKHTPPGTPSIDKNEVKDLLCTRKISQAGSTPNLSTLESENIASRLKRKRNDCSSTDCVNEIRSLLAISTAQSDNKFAALQSAMSEIIAQNTDIKDSIAFISKQYDDMKLKVQSLESEREADRCQILQLEDKVETLERLLHSTKIEIRNVPKKQGENKEDLCRIVTDLTKVLSTPVQKHEIKDVFRGGKKEGVSPIVVDFVSTMSKDAIIKGVRLFNSKNGQNKLNTTHLNLDGPTKPIYLSERLTSKNQHIYYLARTFAKENGFKFCWTSYGKVFLRRDEGQHQVHIRNEADLVKLHQEK